MELPEYNPDKAKKLLAEAGHPHGFTIKDYFISTSFFCPKMLTLVQGQLKKVGINVEVQLIETAGRRQCFSMLCGACCWLCPCSSGR